MTSSEDALTLEEDDSKVFPIQPDSPWKMRWDGVVFFTITVSAFEVPYSIAVGWSDVALQHRFDLLIYGIFFTDLVLNFLTIRERSYAGFLEWRDIAGHINFERWSPENHRQRFFQHNPNAPRDELVRDYRGIGREYIRSKWFWIDTISVIPFEYIFPVVGYNTLARLLRLARLPRLIRLIRAVRLLRVLRTLKGASMARRHRQLVREHPAMMRFFLLGVAVPWCVHVSACLLCIDTGATANAELYWAKVSEVFFAMKSADMPPANTLLGSFVGVFVMFAGMTFFATFVGNFASLFSNFDQQGSEITAVQKRWVGLFRKYPEVFFTEEAPGVDASETQSEGSDRKNAWRKQILSHVRDEVLSHDTIDEDHALICALSDELESTVRHAFNSARFRGMQGAPGMRLQEKLHEDERDNPYDEEPEA